MKIGVIVAENSASSQLYFKIAYNRKLFILNCNKNSIDEHKRLVLKNRIGRSFVREILDNFHL